MNRLLLIFIICLVILAFVCLIQWVGGCDEIDDLVPYIIQVESSGNPNAVSKSGCIGLMQINPKGALAEWNNSEVNKGWEIRDKLNKYHLYCPVINQEIGTWYLRRLKDHYLKDDYTIERMLASYNGGITRLRRLLREGKDWQDMPRESVSYVKKALKLYKRGER